MQCISNRLSGFTSILIVIFPGKDCRHITNCSCNTMTSIESNMVVKQWEQNDRIEKVIMKFMMIKFHKTDSLKQNCLSFAKKGTIFFKPFLTKSQEGHNQHKNPEKQNWWSYATLLTTCLPITGQVSLSKLKVIHANIFFLKEIKSSSGQWNINPQHK